MLSGDAAKLAQSFLLAAASYGDYKEGVINRCLDKLDRAIAIDLDLYQNLPEITAHLVQLLHNKARALVRYGDRSMGMRLYTRLLHFLESGEVLYDVEQLRGLDFDFRLLEGFHHQVSSDFVTEVGRNGYAVPEVAGNSTQIAAFLRYVAEKDFSHALIVLEKGPRPSAPMWWFVVGGLMRSVDSLTRQKVQAVADRTIGANVWSEMGKRSELNL